MTVNLTAVEVAPSTLETLVINKEFNVILPDRDCKKSDNRN